MKEASLKMHNLFSNISKIWLKQVKTISALAHWKILKF
jgi:hypothetical protein